MHNKEGRGAIFKNNDENPHPSAPGHRGRCTIAGVEYSISGWVNTSQKGEKYLSLKFDRAPDADQAQSPESPY
jgi:hypothetical protein